MMPISVCRSTTNYGTLDKSLERQENRRDMNHPIYRVIECEIVSPYTLRVAFDDKTEQVIDF